MTSSPYHVITIFLYCMEKLTMISLNINTKIASHSDMSHKRLILQGGQI